MEKCCICKNLTNLPPDKWDITLCMVCLKRLISVRRRRALESGIPIFKEHHDSSNSYHFKTDVKGEDKR